MSLITHDMANVPSSLPQGNISTGLEGERSPSIDDDHVIFAAPQIPPYISHRQAPFLFSRQIYLKSLEFFRSSLSSFRSSSSPAMSLSCPVALFEIYRLIIFFTVPSLYQSKLSSLLDTSESQSANVFSDIADDPELSSDWKNVGYICGILLSVLGTLLQIPSVVASPLATMLVVLSLICAFEGLLTSIICFSHLAGIKNEDHARAWVKLACDTQRGCRWWNLPVLLALPSVNTAWSIILFVFALSASFACPQIICAKIDAVLAGAKDTTGPVILGTVILIRVLLLVTMMQTLRSLHWKCWQYDERELESLENGVHGARPA